MSGDTTPCTYAKLSTVLHLLLQLLQLYVCLHHPALIGFLRFCCACNTDLMQYK